MPKLIPRPYQVEGIEFLRNKKKAMLFDEPGLGKTLQAAEAAERPVLVAAPAYLTEQWADFLIDQYPEDKVMLCDGDATMRLAGLLCKSDWWVINHEMLDRFKMPRVRTLILDEMHHFKNRGSKRAQAALRLIWGWDELGNQVRRSIPRVYGLTATPVKREIDDLYMQLRLLDPARFTSYWRFIDTYCKALDYGYGTTIYGNNRTTLPQLRRIVAEYGMGRTYGETKQDLPELIERVIEVPMNKSFLKAYLELKSWGRTQYEDAQGNTKEIVAKNIINALRRLIAGYKPKIDTILGLVEDEPTGKPIVTFSWFRESAQILGDLLGADQVITGAIASNLRPILAKQAQHVVANIAALSEGVDLSRARCCIFAEEEYTPGSMKQAMSRVHRGSDDPEPVRCYYVHVKDSIDGIIHRKWKSRGASAREVLEEALR